MLWHSGPSAEPALKTNGEEKNQMQQTRVPMALRAWQIEMEMAFGWWRKLGCWGWGAIGGKGRRIESKWRNIR